MPTDLPLDRERHPWDLVNEIECRELGFAWLEDFEDEYFGDYDCFDFSHRVTCDPNK